MNDDVFNAMGGLGIKKVESVMGRGKMAIHTIGHKSLGIVYMGGGLPRVIGKLNFVARCAKLGCGGTHHSIVGNAKEGESDDNADNNEYKPFEVGFHEYPHPMGHSIRKNLPDYN